MMHLPIARIFHILQTLGSSMYLRGHTGVIRLHNVTICNQTAVNVAVGQMASLANNFPYITGDGTYNQ